MLRHTDGRLLLLDRATGDELPAPLRERLADVIEMRASPQSTLNGP
jgi:hypothetical protein